MEGAEHEERDSTQDWLVPAGSVPLLGELELKVDAALAIAKASEAGVVAVGEAALDAALQARRAAELAESASIAAWQAAGSVAGPLAAGDPPSPNPDPSPTSEFTVVSPGDPDAALRRFTERADRVAARLQAV